MLTLTLAIAFSAAPPIVMVERDSRAPSAATQKAERWLRAALEAEGATVAEGLTPCGAERDCLLARARVARTVAVALSVVRGRKGVLVDLEATMLTGRDLGAVTFALPGGERPPNELIAFAKRVAVAWAELPDEAQAPVAVTPVVPEPVVAPQASVSTSFWSRAPSHVTLWSGVVSGATAIALGVAGAVVRGSLDASLAAQPPVLTRPQALDQAALANGLLTAALVSALVAGVAAVLFTTLFAANGG